MHAFAEDWSVQELEFMFPPVIHMHGFFFHFENMESILSFLFDLIICLQRKCVVNANLSPKATTYK